MKQARLLIWISLIAFLFPGWSGEAQTLTVTNNLVMWLKADSLALANGAPISTWADSSTNLNHATQQTSGNQPAFVANAINGNPVVRFDGSSDFLAVTNKLDLTGFRRVQLPNGLTYLAVFRTTNTYSTHSYPLNAPLSLIGDNTQNIENGFG